MSGLIADSRTLIDKARVEAQVSTLIVSSERYRISPSTSRSKNKSKSNFLGKNVSKIVGSNISRTRNSAKIRDPNDAKFHRSAHYTVESLVPQSTISPDMLVKDPKL